MAAFAYTFEAMTTPCEVLLYHDSKSVADALAKSILEEAKRLEKKYNYFDSSSLLSKLNTREEDALDTETKNLLQSAKKYYLETDKTFDITIATLKNLYHDKQDKKNLKKQKEALLPYVGCEHFSIKKNRLFFDNKHTKIDFGGLVKEYAVDRAIMIVKKKKIHAALVNFGGDIYALGLKPNGDKFKIGITDPHKRDEHCHFIELSNQALTTSASYERSIMIEGESYSHILSKNAPQKVSSVTVVSNSCVESGVYSTALMINPKLHTKNQTYIIN